MLFIWIWASTGRTPKRMYGTRSAEFIGNDSICFKSLLKNSSKWSRHFFTCSSTSNPYVNTRTTYIFRYHSWINSIIAMKPNRHKDRTCFLDIIVYSLFHYRGGSYGLLSTECVVHVTLGMSFPSSHKLPNPSDLSVSCLPMTTLFSAWSLYPCHWLKPPDVVSITSASVHFLLASNMSSAHVGATQGISLILAPILRLELVRVCSSGSTNIL